MARVWEAPPGRSQGDVPSLLTIDKPHDKLCHLVSLQCIVVGLNRMRGWMISYHICTHFSLFLFLWSLSHSCLLPRGEEYHLYKYLIYTADVEQLDRNVRYVDKIDYSNKIKYKSTFV